MNDSDSPKFSYRRTAPERLLAAAGRRWQGALIGLACVCSLSVSVRAQAAPPANPNSSPAAVNFNRDIRPILSDRCYRCHGPDATARQADLRLDIDSGWRLTGDDLAVVEPGRSLQSELFRRITSTDDDVRMPPPESGLRLSAGEIELIRRWIDAGAPTQLHWSFLPLDRPDIPNVEQPAWCRNAIDRFVLAELERNAIAPSPEADKERLIRRVTFDLTGLPPTTADVDLFLSDDSPDAYERMVDRLLGSPRYGERMALVWLDAARFADSGGYQGDILRSMWPWRDWVINAYNANMPFDRFSMEQLAGDLLPEPTKDQLIATGFNRNHRINDEDGIILEEFRVEYVVDRVNTTSTVWMGLTMGCAQCHDHKYDPITQRAFYRFFAYFNSVDEQGRGHGSAPPVLAVYSPETERRLAAVERELTVLATTDQPPGDGPDPSRSGQQTMTQAVKSLNEEKQTLEKQAVPAMVMRDRDEPRDTFVLIRGAYDQPGESVTCGVPEVLPPLPEAAAPNRLGMATWLFDPSHPLTARVAVNRYWQMHFGVGIVATPEDFGSQGEWPTHPELLDWLATEFIRTGWDVKRLHRLIVTSAAYRQNSRGTPELRELDPNNRLLARGPRFRLPAETIRDLALSAGGLLVERLGGPSVRPYQPEGLWKELASVDLEYGQEHGPGLYRRSLYTFIRRTVPPPSMKAFDAPNREICAVRRARTNTPLQALALMNDPTYVEACRALAERVLRSANTDPAVRLAIAFRLLTARSPSEPELQILLETLADFQARYRDDGAAAARLLAVGESAVDAGLDVPELAAYTAVVGVIMNLDETITKE